MPAEETLSPKPTAAQVSIFQSVKFRAARTESCPSLDLLALPAGMDEEETRQLAALSARLRDTVLPADVLEEFWVHEVMLSIWEVQRLQTCKASLLRNTREEALAHLLVGRVEGAHLLSLQARQGRQQARDALDVAMRAAGLSESDVAAQSFLLNLETFERIDELINRASSKVTRLIKEIETRRMRLAALLRAVVQQEIPSEGDVR